MSLNKTIDIYNEIYIYIYVCVYMVPVIVPEAGYYPGVPLPGSPAPCNVASSPSVCASVQVQEKIL